MNLFSQRETIWADNYIHPLSQYFLRIRSYYSIFNFGKFDIILADTYSQTQHILCALASLSQKKAGFFAYSGMEPSGYGDFLQKNAPQL